MTSAPHITTLPTTGFHRLLIGWFLAIYFCTAATWVTVAQVPPDSSVTTPRNFVLDEMVISASRWEQNLREVPNTVVKIGSSLVQFQNPQTAADLLALSNSVFIQKSQLGGGSPMIRGFGTSRVLMVVDGVRLNNAIIRSGNAQNVISLDANTVSQAEVIFGPGSVMYGSDAIGGVMDFHTLNPQLSTAAGKMEFNGTAMMRYASANHERTMHTDLNFGGDKWAFLSSISVAVYDDLRMGTKGPEEYTRPDFVAQENGSDVVKRNPDPDLQIPSGYDQVNVMQKIHFAASDHLQFTYGFQYAKTSDYARYDRLLLRSNGSLVNAEWYYGPQKWQMHSLTVNQAESSFLSDHNKLVIAYQEYEESRHNRAFGNQRKTNRFEKVKALSVNVDVDKNVGDAIILNYGVEGVANWVGSTAYSNNVQTGETMPVSTRYPDGARWSTYAAYASAKYKWHQWILNASGRITHVSTRAEFDDTFFDFPFAGANVESTAFNGSLGLIWNPNEAWKIFGNLSSGFRAPNVDDIGKVFDSEPGNVVVPNPNLEPEKALGVELGSIGEVGEHLSVELSAFYTLINNAIARGESTFNGSDSILYDGVLSQVLSQQNISRVNVFGVEAIVQWRLSKSLQIRSTYNWQTGKEEDSETGRNFSPTHVAPIFGATHILFERNKLKMDLYANYNGEISFENLAPSERGDEHLYTKDEEGNPYAPRWWTLNLKGSWKANSWMSVDAGIENIFDIRYRPYSSGISAPGRNFIAALRFRL